MLHFYAVNEAGASHRDAGLPCQDAFCALRLAAGPLVACVADGLGSARLSQVGSAVASHSCAHAVARELADDAVPARWRPAIERAFASAEQAVLAAAAERCVDPGELDTTLCCAVFDGSSAAWGNAGDSGALCALEDGTYVPLTTQDRDDEGRVYPLCFDDRWTFGAQGRAASVLLATDGVLECLAPPALAAQGLDPIDTRIARMFLHPQPGDGERLPEVEREASAYFADYPRSLLDDDMTLVALFDDERAPGEREAGYYDGPDWEQVRARAIAALYR